MKLVLVGPGAFGAQHLAALAQIEDVEIISVVGPDQGKARSLADEYCIPHTDLSLEVALERSDVEAVILTSPSNLHATQAMECLRAGKHVAIEIPAGTNWPEIDTLNRLHRRSDLVCSVGHTRRYNPSHQWLKRNIENGTFTLQHLQVQTFFHRRTNTNALGEARDWTDHLLWHHAAHTVDLFLYQTGETITYANILAGPEHANLGIAMDLSIQMQSETGKLLTLALSFNHQGPLGTTFRYIGDTGTYIARYDELTDGNGVQIDLSSADKCRSGIELQDRDFIDSIRTGTTPRSCLSNVLPCYEVLRDLESQLAAQRGAVH